MVVEVAYIFNGLLYYVGRIVSITVAQPILLGMVVVVY